MDEQHLDEMFDRFRAGPSLAVPAGADAARQAFRRRRVRTAAGCALAAVAVGLPSVAFAAGTFDRRPNPPVVTTAPTPDRTRTQGNSLNNSAAPTTPPPLATRQPEPTGVPTAAMLTESDLPAGYQRRLGTVGGDWTLASTTIYCTGPAPKDPQPRGVAQLEAVFVRGPDENVAQQVVRMRSTRTAQAWIEGLQFRLGTGCGGVAYQNEASNFIADTANRAGSIIVRATIDGKPGFYLFVQQGPLVTQIWRKGETNAEVLRDLAWVAADRLCAGTAAC